MRIPTCLGLLVLSLGAFGCAASMSAAPPPSSGSPATVAAIAPEKKVSSGAVAPQDGDAEAEPEPATVEDFKGNLWGDSIGDAGGAAGLGLSGEGKGGGGRGEGIGLGKVGTIGHGAGTGTGQGYGSGSGRMSTAEKKSAGRVSAATATTTGAGLPPEVIQRIMRQRMAKVRYCYEKALEKNATLSGKIAVKFTINAAGGVASAAASDTTIADAEMVSCVISSVLVLSFPQPEGGAPVVVTYPFNFAPADP